MFLENAKKNQLDLIFRKNELPGISHHQKQIKEPQGFNLISIEDIKNNPKQSLLKYLQNMYNAQKDEVQEKSQIKKTMSRALIFKRFQKNEKRLKEQLATSKMKQFPVDKQMQIQLLVKSKTPKKQTQVKLNKFGTPQSVRMLQDFMKAKLDSSLELKDENKRYGYFQRLPRLPIFQPSNSKLNYWSQDDLQDFSIQTKTLELRDKTQIYSGFINKTETNPKKSHKKQSSLNLKPLNNQTISFQVDSKQQKPKPSTKEVVQDNTIDIMTDVIKEPLLKMDQDSFLRLLQLRNIHIQQSIGYWYRKCI